MEENQRWNTIMKINGLYKSSRNAQIGVVSFGSDCPSQGVYGRVTKIKHWIQFIAGGAVDTNCDEEIPWTPGVKII